MLISFTTVDEALYQCWFTNLSCQNFIELVRCLRFSIQNIASFIFFSVRYCSLADFDHVIPSDGSDQSVYMYADDVNVTCQEGFYLEGFSTTDMTVTCMHTGKWSHNLTCGSMWTIHNLWYFYIVSNNDNYQRVNVSVTWHLIHNRNYSLFMNHVQSSCRSK